MKKIVLIIICLLSFISCKNSIIENSDDIKDVDFNSEEVLKKISEDYFQNQITMDNIVSRNVITTDDYPRALYELNLKDKNGNSISFNDLTENEKDIFYNIWKSKSVEIILDEIKEDEDISKMLFIENSIFEESITDNERSAEKVNADKILTRYFNNIKKYAVKQSNTARSSSSNSGSLGKTISSNSVRILYNNFRPGRILVTDGASLSSSSEVGLGHASLIGLNKININETNGDIRYSISSFPLSNDPYWTNKTDGVQYEPLSLWAGNKEPSIRKVIVYDMQKNEWVWDWFNSGYKKSPAPISDYYEAARYAESMIGRPYKINPAKDSEESFYCSKLVWKAWRQIDKDYDMSNGFFITPSNIISAAQTKRVTDFENY